MNSNRIPSQPRYSLVLDFDEGCTDSYSVEKTWNVLSLDILYPVVNFCLYLGRFCGKNTGDRSRIGPYSNSPVSSATQSSSEHNLKNFDGPSLSTNLQYSFSMSRFQGEAPRFRRSPMAKRRS